MKRTSPTVCPHCYRYVFNAPGWLGVLVALSPGKGRRKVTDTHMNQTQISKKLGVTREMARQWVGQAHAARAIDAPFPGVYTKSKWGHLLLCSWKRAGFVHGKRVTQKAAREAMRG